MLRTYNWVKDGVKRLTRQAQDEDLVTLWLSLPMLVVVLLWETLRRPLNHFVPMLIDKIRSRARFSTRTNTSKN